MKKIILLVALLATVGFVNAQEGKQRILIEYLTDPATKSEAKYTDILRNNVLSGIDATKRLIVIDVDSEESLKIEESRRSSEMAMGDETARNSQIIKLGAHYILRGSLDKLTCTKEKKDDGKVYYKSTLEFTLKIIDTANGSMFASETYKIYGGGSLLGAGSTEEKAISGALSLVKGKMEDFINVYFPLEGNVVELNEVKKGKLKSCYVNLGADNGVAAGQYIKVSKVKMIAGTKSTLEVGSLKVEEVVAGTLSMCKVLKGGDEILEAFNKGEELVVVTTKDKGFLTGLGL